MINVISPTGKVGSVLEIRLNSNGAMLSRMVEGREIHYWIPKEDLHGVILISPAIPEDVLVGYEIPKHPEKAQSQPFLEGLDWEEGEQYGWP